MNRHTNPIAFANYLFTYEYRVSVVQSIDIMRNVVNAMK